MDIKMYIKEINKIICHNFSMKLINVLQFEPKLCEIVLHDFNFENEKLRCITPKMTNDSFIRETKYLNYFKEFLIHLLNPKFYNHIKGYYLRLSFSDTKIYL